MSFFGAAATLALLVTPTSATAQMAATTAPTEFPTLRQRLDAWQSRDGLAAATEAAFVLTAQVEVEDKTKEGEPDTPDVRVMDTPTADADEDQPAMDTGSDPPDQPDSAAKELDQRVGTIEKAWQRFQDDEKKKKLARRVTELLSVQLQVDSYWFNQDANSVRSVGDIENGTAFRRARFGFQGDAFEVFDYRVEFDFALAGRPTFLDVYGGVKHLPYLGNVRVGHFFEPYSLERITRNRFTTFMERNMTDQAFAPARNTGIMVFNWTENERTSWSLGGFRINSDVFGDDVSDDGGNAVTGRVTHLLWYDEATNGRYLFHTGFCYSFRDPNQNTVRFRAQPEARLGAAIPNVPFFVDTGNLVANYYQLLDLELAWVHGPWSMQAEYNLVPVDQVRAPNPVFQGGYVQATYFLTGESRPYLRWDGTFTRVIPYENFFWVKTPKAKQAGWGAWEVAGRVSHLDLDNQAVLGGRLTDFTVGINWYLSPYTRITANYVRALLDNPTFGDSGTDIFAVRFGFDF